MNYREEYFKKTYHTISHILQQGENKESTVSRILSAILYDRVKLNLLILLGRHHERVAFGPFAGMRLPREIAEYPYSVPGYVLGCYEEELHPTIWKIANTHYDIIIDIGCAIGYYAVGLARMMPATRIYAFDTDKTAQTLCRQVIDTNQVANQVTLHETCTADTFAQLQQLPGKKLIICDIEGAEYELLNPEQSPVLKELDILVELHPTPVYQTIEPCHDIIVKRFTSTHHIEYIPPTSRNWANYDIDWLSPLDRDLVLLDGRTFPTPWLFMTTR